MTLLVRAFLLSVSFQWSMIAWAFIDDPERYEQALSFTIIFDMLPIEAWDVLLIVVAVLGVVAAISGNFISGRVTCCLSAGISAAWTLAFIFDRLEDPKASLVFIGIFGSLVVRDFVLSRMPYGRVVEFPLPLTEN